jgi:hypothetical protein
LNFQAGVEKFFRQASCSGQSAQILQSYEVKLGLFG